MYRMQNVFIAGGAFLFLLLPLYFFNTTRNFNFEKSNLGSIHQKFEGREDNNRASPQFVFFIGLEGTGHHLMQTVAVASPIVKDLRDFGIYPHETKKLDDLLFYKNEGLLQNPFNITEKEEEVAQMLVSLKRRAAQKGRGTINMIPLNTLHKFMSYPFGFRARHQKFPILGLIYRACNKAEVDCNLVYLYRDAYEIINSAFLHREFFPKEELYDNLRLYIAILRYISMQLLSHADSVISCVSLFGGREWVEPMMDLWGYHHRSSIEQLYRAPTSNKTNIPAHMIPIEMQPLMDLMEESNEQAMAICKEITSDSGQNLVLPRTVPGGSRLR